MTELRPPVAEPTMPPSMPKPADDQTGRPAAGVPPAALPAAVKWGFTAFMTVLVPYYWATYGPTNFLYFCDVALFLTLWAVWSERALPASMAAVGIVLPQLFWQLDFLTTWVGSPLFGLTGYMFNPDLSLLARGLSFFHFWLPILLVYLVAKLGYDRRALAVWTLLAWALVLIAATLLPGAGEAIDFPNQPRNVNYVDGFSATERQTWMPGWLWTASLMVALPLLVYGPTHAALSKWRGLPRGASRLPVPSEPSAEQPIDSDRTS